MHVKFPDDAAETIGDDEYPKDTWAIRRKYHDSELWGLVKDGILGGYSIGDRISTQRRGSTIPANS